MHALEVTAANVSDVAEAHALVRPGDERVWADAGYACFASMGFEPIPHRELSRLRHEN